MNRDAGKLNVDQQSEVQNFRANIGQTYNLMYEQQQVPQTVWGGNQKQVSDIVSQNIYQASRINKTKWSKNTS